MSEIRLRTKGLTRNTKVFIALGVVILVLFGISGLIKPRTLQPRNVVEVIRQSVPLGISAIGQSAVILSGGIDLSVGEVITMTNIVSADLMAGRPENTIPVILLVLSLGAVIGGVTGLLVARTNIHPMVMTFAMGSIVRGGYLLYSGGAPRGRVSPFLRLIGSKSLGPIPVSLLLYAVVIFLVMLLFQRTRWGYSVHYLGANLTAARYTGVPVTSRLVFTYGFSSVMAVVSGLVLSGYIGIGNFDVGGNQYMLNSIAASVVGGCTFIGIGNVVGGALGALIITVISSVMTFFGIAETGKLVMRGMIIIIMVAVYMRQAVTGTILGGRIRRRSINKETLVGG